MRFDIIALMSLDTRKIAFVMGAHWFAGPTIFLRRAFEALPRLGWSPHLILTGGRDSKAIDIRTWPAPVTRLGPFYSYGKMGEQTAEAIRKSAAEIVVGSADHASVLAMQMLYRGGESKIRLLEMLHADLESEFVRLNKISPIVTAACGISDAVVREIKCRVTILAGRIFRWYCPVPCPAELPSRTSQPRPLRLIYSGRVVQEEKRALDLVSIAQKLMERGIDFHLTVAGDGPELTELKSRVQQIGAAKRCSFPGWVDSTTLQAILRKQDVFLMTSSTESMGLALLEAMAHGVVPVVTNLPGPSEVVREDTGYRVPVGDTEGFAQAIECIAGGRVPLEQMRSACWRLVRAHYSIEAAMASYAAMLEDVARLPLPDWRRLHRLIYPCRLMDRFGVPQAIQDFKRRKLRQELWP
jgi:glycosyltransferase involved in cell wall biosynthesis